MVFIFGGALLCYYDLKDYRLPHVITVPMLGIALIINAIKGALLGFSMAAMLMFFAFFSLGRIGKLAFKKEAIGGGDMVLAATIAGFFGIQTAIIATYIGFICAGMLGLGLRLIKGKSKQDILPFGPFLILATLIAEMFKPELLSLLP